MAKYKILRVHKVAYLVLVATVLLFVMSIVLSISEADALRAYQDNISARLWPLRSFGAAVKYMSVVLNVFSIVTAFPALYLAVHESFVGLIKVTVEKWLSLRQTIARRFQWPLLSWLYWCCG